jgi:putative ABC transport system permease protein
MKYFPLVWASLWRKRPRTLFTLASILIAFLLLGLLQGINAAFNQVVERSHVDRLLTSNASFLPLPLAQLAQIERVPGVKRVAYAFQFAASYQDAKNALAPIATDPQRWFDVYADWKLPAEQLDAFIRTRTGAVAGAELAEKHGWKIGDRVALRSNVVRQDGTADWVVEIVGLLERSDNPGERNALLLNFSYVDAARVLGKGTVLQYEVAIADPNEAAGIAQAIDGIFANSPNQTKTQSEREFAQSMLSQVGDINFFVDAIVGAVFFTLLFVTGNTMMQSIRESIPELAVLKTIGFSDSALGGLVLAQSFLLCAMGACLGLAAAAVAFPLAQSLVGGVRMSWTVVCMGAVAAALLALVSGLAPAWRAKRLEIVDALARQ